MNIGNSHHLQGAPHELRNLHAFPHPALSTGVSSVTFYLEKNMEHFTGDFHTQLVVVSLILLYGNSHPPDSIKSSPLVGRALSRPSIPNPSCPLTVR